MTDILSRAEALLASAGWRTDMESAPRDKRIPVRTEHEEYIGHWAQNPFTGDEGWIIGQWGDEGDQLIVKPVMWHAPIPAPDTPDPLAATVTDLIAEVRRLREELKLRESDISILVADVHWMEDVSGESLDGEDGEMFRQIEAEHEARALSGGSEGGGHE